MQLGWLPTSGDHVSMIVTAFAFAFPPQLLVCVFGFIGRNIVVGTAMGILGARDC
ncbi:hypothetical protein F4561_003674 [Lipingzhangella halophila]|uniref:Uncharacterized protein n=1 Tax=Lipingzhangella halophila TaxID=1783352 RepID=A0A7W7RIY3_9ACTN|nr:hypothetical protein [Lipingzhangella halophila]